VFGTFSRAQKISKSLLVLVIKGHGKSKKNALSISKIQLVLYPKPQGDRTYGIFVGCSVSRDL